MRLYTMLDLEIFEARVAISCYTTKLKSFNDAFFVDDEL